MKKKKNTGIAQCDWCEKKDQKVWKICQGKNWVMSICKACDKRLYKAEGFWR